MRLVVAAVPADKFCPSFFKSGFSYKVCSRMLAAVRADIKGSYLKKLLPCANAFFGLPIRKIRVLKRNQDTESCNMDLEVGRDSDAHRGNLRSRGMCLCINVRYISSIC